MSIIICKYIHSYGWIGIKTEKRVYKPSVKIRKSFRDGIERLLLWDRFSKYSEGLNEYGVGILTLSGNPVYRSTIKQTKASKGRYYCPLGFSVRKALQVQSPSRAARTLLYDRQEAQHVIFNKDECYVVTSNDSMYSKINKVREVSVDEVVVIGSKEHDDDSGLEYLEYININIDKMNTIDELLVACLFDNKDNDNLFNINNKGSSHKTAFQVVLMPKHNTMHYNNIWCDVKYNLERLNSLKQKTFFEIVSRRKLIELINNMEK